MHNIFNSIIKINMPFSIEIYTLINNLKLNMRIILKRFSIISLLLKIKFFLDIHVYIYINANFPLNLFECKT
jgi:hypothetical protein